MKTLCKIIFQYLKALIVITLLFDCVSAQEFDFGQLTVENGLSNSFVNCLIQDKTGFIWFGTDDGLNRFDGYEIKVYRNDPDDKFSLSENIIWALCEDHYGNLWIGTKTGGLNKYNPGIDKFERWNIDSTVTEEINITSIYEDSQKNIWVGTYKHGLYRFNPVNKKMEHWLNTPDNPDVLSDNFITSIIEDQYSNVWIASYSGLDKFLPDHPEKIFKPVLKDSKYPIWYLAKSKFFEKKLWIGSLNGLMIFDPTEETFFKIELPENSGLRFGSSVSSITEEIYLGEKIIWAGTFGGLVRRNLSSDRKERFIKSKEDETGLLSNQIHDIIIDRSGVLWIVSENGINFYSTKRLKFNLRTSALNLQKIPDFFKNNVRAISQTKDETLWFGTDAGLYGIGNRTGNSSIIGNSELQKLNVWSLSAASSDKLWIGTYGQGLKELNIKTNELKQWKIANPDFNTASYNYIKTVLEDKDGQVWIGFWGAGLARVNTSTRKINHWHNEENNLSSLSYNDVWALFEDSKGRIWIGTNGGGLDLFQGEKQMNFYNWSTDGKQGQKLSSNNIFSICESVYNNKQDNQSILWIGTANGLNKFVIKNDSGSSEKSKLNVEIKHYTVKDGLPDNAVESILEDENGNLWIATSTGITFFNIDEEQFTNYTVADGLTGSSFNSSAAYKNAKGTILFGSTIGLNFFDPDKITKSTYSPPIVITDFQILNQPAGTKKYSTSTPGDFNQSNIELANNQNDLSFQFAALDYSAPENIQYAYMIDGFDVDWIYSGKRRFVTYTNLDAGEYIFRVKATNSDGVWSDQKTEIFIVINPPFWKTWWAYTIYAIAFVGSLIFIRSVEVKKRKKKEEERLKREREEARLREAELKAINIEQEKEIEKQKIRNRIAQDLHDEIGSNLSSISLMSELIQNSENINDEASEKIKRIHKVAKGSTQAIRDIVWLTNPSSDSLKDLIAKMKEVADNNLGKFNLNFEYPKDINEINLPPETKRNIFFIYKEALNNIIKHAEAKSVEIKFRFDSKTIFLSIKDDGKGIDSSVVSVGNGLKNIRLRTNELNGELKFESCPGRGTLIELSANITQMRD